MMGVLNTEKYTNILIKSIFTLGMIMILSCVSTIRINAADVDTKRYYYNQLTDEEKKIYEQLEKRPDINSTNAESYDALKDFTITTTSKTAIPRTEYFDILNRAFVAYAADNPWANAYYGGGWRSSFEGLESDKVTSFVCYYEPQMLTDSYYAKKAKARYDQIIKTVGTSGDRYTKLRKIYDILRNSVSYDQDYLSGSEQKVIFNTTVLGPLAEGKSICDGLDDTFKLLCDSFDIPCIEVGNNQHAWNYVQMEDGEWYSVDMTAALASDANVEWQDGLLLGSKSYEYDSNSIYHSSELYMGREGWFTFPELAENQYEYSGSNSDFGYTLVESSFVDGDCNTSGHKYGTAQWTPNDCTHDQYANYICDQCRNTVKIVWEKSFGHIYGTCQYIWSDDGKECVGTAVCNNNESHVLQEKATITSEVTKPATCKSNGITTYTATFENVWLAQQKKEVEDITVDPSAHDFGEWIVVKPATQTEEGLEQRVCKNDSSHVETRKIDKQPIEKGGKMTDKSTGATYKVTVSDIVNPEVEYTGSSNKKSVKNVTIPDIVTINGLKYKVTSIADKAFNNNKKLTKVTVGENVTKIGKNAFSGAKNLKTITIKSKKIKSIGKNALKNINKKATIKVTKKLNKKQFAKYKKMLKKAGLSKKAKIKKG